MKSSILGIKVIIEHKVLAFPVFSHEGNWWIRAVLGFLFLHTNALFLFQSLFDSHKTTSLSLLRVTPLGTHIQESIAQLLRLLPSPGDRIPVLYRTRGSHISPPDVTHGAVHMDTPCTPTATWSLWPRNRASTSSTSFAKLLHTAFQYIPPASCPQGEHNCVYHRQSPELPTNTAVPTHSAKEDMRCLPPTLPGAFS